MKVPESQMKKLGAPGHREFIQKTIAFLREEASDWSEGKDDEEIICHIENMIEIGKDRGIIKELNIQKLLYYSFNYGLEIPFSKRVEELLAFNDLPEDNRVRKLIKEIKTRHVR